MTRQNSKNTVISICFAEPEINNLFSELLRSKGMKTRIVDSVQQVSGETKIVTEPQFFPEIPTAYRNECLIVGNKDSLKGLTGVTLSRPLTEDKIEFALQQFLE